MLGSNVFTNEHDGDENGGVDNSYSFDSVDDACLLYCERFMEFLIDLLSQLPTRRYAAVSTFSNIFLVFCEIWLLYVLQFYPLGGIGCSSLLFYSFLPLVELC